MFKKRKLKKEILNHASDLPRFMQECEDLEKDLKLHARTGCKNDGKRVELLLKLARAYLGIDERENA